MIQPGELRCLRVVLRNRGTYGLVIRVDTSGAADNLSLSFKEQPMPPGVPRVMDIDACFDQPGEYTGEIRVRWGKCAACLACMALLMLVSWTHHGLLALQ